ncbi:hypothetical protein [Methylotuvimicrobium alcaliphilum]|uniref:Biotin transporter n=1 Tax=Methylotuvimicrobium alcaliphilum (strain DSM 19304 / NCIMB 14124 / VKM B-2133 / 20Z) TaxID=1091494 RepID=G4T3E5_META2|nr:hypothetical protein [Methylotuvimicrobium alcaliphilum]CCE22637.1 conserved membrane protein of unknown function [Methylotuvimicrobium alcaliphilum 20Z]
MNIAQRLPVQNLPIQPGAIALMLLMAATRSSHIGTPFQLPDASLAVFFLAGLWFGGNRFFAVLLAEAALIDFVVIQFFGVSSFCVSPAYAFLIPTYAAVWFGGKMCAQFKESNPSVLLKQFAILLAATTLAFLISEFSFYLLSGRHDALDWSEKLSKMANFYPAYIKSTLIYATAIFGVVALLKSLPIFSEDHKGA